MDTIENLIIAIVKPLISHPDQLTIRIEDTPEFLEYHGHAFIRCWSCDRSERSDYLRDKDDCLFGPN